MCNVNATGIYKTHPKSRIAKMHINSSLVDRMLNTQTPIVDGKEIVVLQVVSTVKECILVEFVYKKDYDAKNIVFNPDGSQKKGE